MTVSAQHKEYGDMAPKWKRCRDVAAGLDAIRHGAQSYLPRLEGQSAQEYQKYLMRASFFNATWRTINGLTGMLFRRPEIVEIPASVESFMDDVTMSGEPLHLFVQEVAEECFTVGRCGVMVDYPTVDEAGMLSVADAEGLGLRPSLQRYTAESVINWRAGRVGNRTKLTQVVLKETATLPKDEFEFDTEDRFRVLDLVPSALAPLTRMVYRMRLFRIDKVTKRDEQIGNDYFPLMAGQPIGEIPFFFLGIDSATVKIDTPPLIDLVDLNLAHFRVSADYEHGCHFTALPTGVVSGYTPMNDNERIEIGSTKMLVFPDTATRAYFLEFSGAGLGALVTNLANKELQMAAIGARLLAQDRRVNETATTAAIHHGGETSILSAVAQSLSLGMTAALRVFAQWAGAAGDVKYEINRDFFPVPMDPSMLSSLVTAWQAGAISSEVLFENLQEGEVISTDRTFETEQAKISSQPPMETSTIAVEKVAQDNMQANNGLQKLREGLQ